MESLRNYLNNVAGKVITVMAITVVPGMLLLFYVTRGSDLIGSLAYLPAAAVILAMALWRLSTTNWGPYPVFQLAVDLACLLGLIGCFVVVTRARQIGLTLTTSPIQTVTALCLSLNFHELKTGISRNIGLIVVAVCCLFGFDIGFTSSTMPQLIVGTALGLAGYALLYFSLKNNYLYKIKVAEEKAHDREKIRLLHKELENKCLPHQLELILLGRSYSQTMPLESRNFWVSKFDISNSSRLHFSNKKKIFHDFFSNCQGLLHENYAFELKNSFQFSIDSEIHLQSDGYLIKTAGDGFFAGYDYPFRIPRSKMIGFSILLSMLRQFKMFGDMVLPYDDSKSVSAVQSLVYGEGGGVFSGKLHNYEIEGDVMTLAARYEGVRKEYYLQDIEMRLLNQTYVLIIQNRVYDQLRRELGGFLEAHCRKIDLEHSVRNDDKGTELYVLYIKHDDIDTIIAELEDLGHERRGVIPMHRYRNNGRTRLA